MLAVLDARCSRFARTSQSASAISVFRATSNCWGQLLPAICLALRNPFDQLINLYKWCLLDGRRDDSTCGNSGEDEDWIRYITFIHFPHQMSIWVSIWHSFTFWMFSGCFGLFVNLPISGKHITAESAVVVSLEWLVVNLYDWPICGASGAHICSDLHREVVESEGPDSPGGWQSLNLDRISPFAYLAVECCGWMVPSCLAQAECGPKTGRTILLLGRNMSQKFRWLDLKRGLSLLIHPIISSAPVEPMIAGMCLALNVFPVATESCFVNSLQCIMSLNDIYWWLVHHLAWLTLVSISPFKC